ncbi:hypothetical protein UFOVP558_69 [uncultured Caudovirales phage]|uniref:Uncharacterized protein n=1 Tax=uncultured Caudovirales phage TaxID=2100421 RepID=A0A6J5MUL1_9CAUD|nr:hypothetical protein UFOVP558_69 [uncultured Caudovirales phage]
MNILGEKILDGPVTIGLVAICFAVCVVVIGVLTYFTQRFQTKADAVKAELDIKTAHEKSEADMKAWIRKVEADVSKMQTSLERIGENVSYIRGRLDPSTQTKI